MTSIEETKEKFGSVINEMFIEKWPAYKKKTLASCKKTGKKPPTEKKMKDDLMYSIVCYAYRMSSDLGGKHVKKKKRSK